MRKKARRTRFFLAAAFAVSAAVGPLWAQSSIAQISQVTNADGPPATGLTDREYNPLSRKNQNDIIDVDQLLYLSDPSLCMMTADGGFKSKVRDSDQAARIITAPASDLMDPDKAELLVRAAFNSHG